MAVIGPIVDPDIAYNCDGYSLASESDLPNTNCKKPNLTSDSIRRLRRVQLSINIRFLGIIFGRKQCGNSGIVSGQTKYTVATS